MNYFDSNSSSNLMKINEDNSQLKSLSLFPEKSLEKNESKSGMEKVKTSTTLNINREPFTALNNSPSIFIPKNKNEFNGKNDIMILKNGDKNEDKNKYQKSKEKKMCGRKRKNSKEKGKHDKYCKDNVIKKIKSSLLEILSKFMNNKINEIYSGNIGLGVFKKEFLKMNQNQIKDSKNNKKFLLKKVKELFSENISTKFTNFPLEHNKNLINDLLNEADNKIREIFEEMLNLTFIECLEHFRGSKYYEILKGLKSLDDFCSNEIDEDYKKIFRYYVFHLEEIIMKKKIKK